MEGSPYRDGIREEQEVIKEKYAELCTEIPDFRQFTYTEFCEAMTIAYSRVFSVQIGHEEIPCIVPFADMMNHKHPA